MTDGGAGDPERRLEMDVEDVVPLLVGHVLDGAVPGEAGVVDDDVEAAEGLDRGADEAVAEIRRGHVAGADRGRAAEVSDGGGGLLGGSGVEVVDHDAGALARQLERDGPADAPARPRHDGDFPVQLGHDPLPLSQAPRIRRRPIPRIT